jgi:hypothetical protein
VSVSTKQGALAILTHSKRQHEACIDKLLEEGLALLLIRAWW